MTGKADAVRAVSQQFKDRTNAVIEGVMAHLNDGNANEILGPGLSPLIGRGTLKSLVTFALYADVLRMVRDMVMADGEISDEEVEESLGVLSVIAGGFAKVRSKDYSAFAQLTSRNARQFLTQYESDTGLFGHANEATKWAGVKLSHMVQSECGDSNPFNTFRESLVTWAEALAGPDGVPASEQVVSESLRKLLGSGGLSKVSSPKPEKALSGDQIQADYQTCEDLLVQGESRDDYIKSHISRLGLWKQAAEAGDARGQLLYGLCFFYGHGEQESEATAFEWFKKSADQGDANAQYALGMCYRNGWGVNPNEKTSTRWLRRAAAQGYRAAVKVLTTTVARGFLKDDSSIALQEFTEIEDEAAKLLSGYEGTLDLMGLYGLSDAAAESLGRHSGALNLQSVGELSGAAAKSLAKHRGNLDLSGLETLCGVEMNIFRNLNSLAPFRLFESFTPGMEALYREAKQKSGDELSNLRLYCHDPSYGRSSHEAFFDFWDTLSKCQKIPLWMMYDEENESWSFFEGTHDELVSRMKRICGYAMDNVGGSQGEVNHKAEADAISDEGKDNVSG